MVKHAQYPLGIPWNFGDDVMRAVRRAHAPHVWNDMAEILNYRNSLPLDTMLFEYRLESVLGAGGFGMTYLAYDTNLEKKVAIKEYLPVEFAMRGPDGAISPVSSDVEYNYTWGLERFLQEARLLAKFSHPNIVVVNRYFEANRTAYMVMNYESGVSFNQLLKRTVQPDEAMLRGMLMPLLEGLQAVHHAGFLHRDIKPSNIFIRDSGAPLLIDFGSARVATSGATRTTTSILTPGYAPLEQYAKDGNQGPWTDIYSLAGVLYRAVVGDNPPDVVTRLKTDTVTESLNASRDRLSADFLRAVIQGMEVDEGKRPQTVSEWKALFGAGAQAMPSPASIASAREASIAAPRSDSDAALTLLAKSPVKFARRKRLMLQLTSFAAGALALFLVIGGIQLFDDTSQEDPSRPAVSSAVQPEAVKDEPPKLTPREFYLLDRDRSGHLARDEVKGDPLLEQNFDAIDRNHDGLISLEEFTSYR